MKGDIVQIETSGFELLAAHIKFDFVFGVDMLNRTVAILSSQNRNSHHIQTSRCPSEGMCAPIPLDWTALRTSQSPLKYANDFLTYSRGGASGNKLKMTLGLPVYVLETLTKTP